MRALSLSLAIALTTPVFAAEVVIVGVYANGKSIDLDQATLSGCAFTEVHGAGVYDCKNSETLALKGGVYQLNKKATARNNKGDPVYTCIRGCARNIVKTVKYITLESGC